MFMVDDRVYVIGCACKKEQGFESTCKTRVRGNSMYIRL